MNIIKRIIAYFKSFFLRFYKNTEADVKQDAASEGDGTANYIIRLRGCIKDYSITDIRVSVNGGDYVEVGDCIGYGEELVFESDCTDETMRFSVKNSVKCVDDYQISNLGFSAVVVPGDQAINITDKFLGLVPIQFSAVVEDFSDFQATKSVTVKL